MRSLRIDAVTAEVTNALRDAGVQNILLKGPTVARWIYRGPERTYVDCDVLVRSRDLRRSNQILEGLGFERQGRDSILHDWPRHAASYGRDGVWVDLHRSLPGVTVDSDRFWAALAAHRASMRVGGSDVDVLDPAGRTLVLALHAAKDGGRVRKPVEDLGRALEALPPELWRAAADLAAEVGAIAAFGAGLRRLPAGSVLASRLGVPSLVTPDIALRTEKAPPLSVGVDWLLRSRGVRGKVGLVVRKIFPPPEFLRDWLPLARRGRWGLLVAYVWRPIWVAWRTVPAFAAVLRARSRARRSGEVTARDGSLPLRLKIAIVARIWWAFAQTGLAERRLPLPELTRRWASRPVRSRARIDARRLGRIVGRVLRFGPWRPRCLFSALVLYRLLREQGEPAQLVIGMQPDPRTKDAHAWVEVNGTDVGPPPGRGRRRPLTRYPYP